MWRKERKKNSQYTAVQKGQTKIERERLNREGLMIKRKKE